MDGCGRRGGVLVGSLARAVGPVGLSGSERAGRALAQGPPDIPIHHDPTAPHGGSAPFVLEPLNNNSFFSCFWGFGPFRR